MVFCPAALTHSLCNRKIIAGSNLKIYGKYITEFYVEGSSQQEGYWLRKMKKVIFCY
jgi:hypothetical protein